jgi:hypothetical protein
MCVCVCVRVWCVCLVCVCVCSDHCIGDHGQLRNLAILRYQVLLAEFQQFLEAIVALPTACAYTFPHMRLVVGFSLALFLAHILNIHRAQIRMRLQNVRECAVGAVPSLDNSVTFIPLLLVDLPSRA